MLCGNRSESLLDGLIDFHARVSHILHKIYFPGRQSFGAGTTAAAVPRRRLALGKPDQRAARQTGSDIRLPVGGSLLTEESGRGCIMRDADVVYLHAAVLPFADR